MDFKNAAAVCMIALFSAGLVVLIARSLDLQAASQLEPQLERIATELETIRKGGGIAASDGAAETSVLDDGLIVYYVHNNKRCVTCRSIESQAQDLVRSDFAEQVDGGTMVWKMLNLDKPAGKKVAESLGVSGSTVVLAKMKDGQLEDSKALDAVWALWQDKPAFAKYVRDGINEMLAEQADEPSSAGVPDIPVPGTDTDDIPIPQDTGAIPVPD